MKLWKSVVGKLWITIIGLVAFVLVFLGLFLLVYIDINFDTPEVVKRLFIYTGMIGFSLTTFFAFFLSTKITQPLLQLKKVADSITLGNYGERVKIRSTDEIGDLARTFNVMAERLEETIRDLKHEKAHLGSVLSSMIDAVITFDAQGRVVLSNPPGHSLLQEWGSLNWVEASETEKSSLVSSAHVPEPLQPLFDKVILATQEHSTNLHVKNEVWSVVMTPLYDDDMKIVRGAVAVMREVTEAERLNKFRQDFVANVSHELRTPIAMLQGYSEALVDDIAGSPEERNELARIINDESQRMGRLVQDLLDLTRMETGHLDMDCYDVDLVALMERVVRKFDALAMDNGIALSTQHEHHPLIADCADEDRLEQVFTNLIDNAIRHTPSGANIMIKSRQLGIDANSYTEIEVIDEGEGIPPEDIESIFERFYKADKARTRGKAAGTGLGLSIVANIIEAHNGTISVQSELGKGTTFKIQLPLYRNHAEKP